MNEKGNLMAMFFLLLTMIGMYIGVILLGYWGALGAFTVGGITSFTIIYVSGYTEME